MFLSSDLKKKIITAWWIEKEREGKRILNYKGLLTQYQNLRYLAEGIQSTVWEKRINVSTCVVASYIIMVERKYTIGPKNITESERSQVKYY